MNKKAILLIATVLFAAAGQAQTLGEIATMQDRYQHCLDSGVDMQGCAKKYCMRMYEIVDTLSARYSRMLHQKERTAFEQEQRAWLKKRAQNEKKQVAEFQRELKSKEWGADMFMLVYDADAEFTRERVVVLIKRIEGR